MAIKYGVIDEDYFSLTYPRTCETVGDTLGEAFEAARVLIEDGTDRVAVVQASFDPKLEAWVQIPGTTGIQIDARDWDPPEEEDDDVEEVEHTLVDL